MICDRCMLEKETGIKFIKKGVEESFICMTCFTERWIGDMNGN